MDPKTITGVGVGAAFLAFAAICSRRQSAFGRIGSLPNTHIRKFANSLQVFQDLTKEARTVSTEEAAGLLQTARINLLSAYEHLISAQEDPRVTASDLSTIKSLQKTWIRANDALTAAHQNLRGRETRAANLKIGTNYRRVYV